jgi:hypothetical protein
MILKRNSIQMQSIRGSEATAIHDCARFDGKAVKKKTETKLDAI